MHNFRHSRGFTLVETMISAVIIAMVILGTINLMSRVYKGINSNQLKTYALSMVSEQLELLKEEGFNNLSVVPDSSLPMPLSNLNTQSIYPVETILYNRIPYTVYKIVQYAQEDSDGNIIPVRQSDIGSGVELNLKQISVYVTYVASGLTVTTSETSYITSKEVSMSGAVVSGSITKLMPSGTPVNPGSASGAKVYVVGYPEYTAIQNASTGQYTINNMMPGSYTLYAEGAGMEQTYYSGNPLLVTETVKTITGINIACPAIDGASITGNVYIGFILTPSNTPTPTATTIFTATPTPASGTITISAVGSMSGKTNNWTDPTNILNNDGNSANNGGVSGRFLYSDFENPSPPADAVITSVSLRIEHLGSRLLSTTSNGTIIYMTNNNGTNWNNSAYPNTQAWTGTSPPSTTYFTISSPCLLCGYSLTTQNITSLYSSWDWTKIDNLGIAFKSNTTYTVYIDYAWIDIGYIIVPPTPTPINTPTYTFTPNSTPTNTPIPCADGTLVRALDGISNTTTSAYCGYTISNIAPTGGLTTVLATFQYGGTSYYKYLSDVPVAIGSTTYLDIWLEEASDLPTANGFVFDSVSNLPVVPADVYMRHTSGVTMTAITSGGGNYTMIAPTPGTYVFTAAAPGYQFNTAITTSINAGLNNVNNLYLNPVGNVSGKVTDEYTGDPVENIDIKVKNSANTLKGEAVTDASGNFFIENIPVSSGYTVAPQLSSDYECTYPAIKKYSGVNVIQGTTSANNNFRVKRAYSTISGTVTVDNTMLKDGILMVAMPVSVTVLPHVYVNPSPDSFRNLYSGREKIRYPYSCMVSQEDASFKLSVPLGTNYNVYAYYSYVSYTGTYNPNPRYEIRNLMKYYKVATNISPGSSVNLSGNLSTWTSY